MSREEFTRLLPEGRNSPDQYIFTIRDDEREGNIGSIWFGVYRNSEPYGAFIWDFQIEEKFRGRGYGKQALMALDKLLREMKIGQVSLHVFGHNDIAISLYRKMGYEVTDLMMAKRIE